MVQVKRSREWKRKARVAIHGAMAACALCLLAAATPQHRKGASEYDVKAAFLLNFTRFIEWPADAFPDAASPFTICVFGEDPFSGALDEVIGGETVNGRKVALQRIKRAPEPKSCQLLFFGRLEKDAPALLERVGPGVLTVGEQPGFLRAGGIIEFVIEGHHVRFDINQHAAANAGLTISARLLNVARTVQQ